MWKRFEEFAKSAALACKCRTFVVFARLVGGAGVLSLCHEASPEGHGGGLASNVCVLCVVGCRANFFVRPTFSSWKLAIVSDGSPCFASTRLAGVNFNVFTRLADGRYGFGVTSFDSFWLCVLRLSRIADSYLQRIPPSMRNFDGHSGNGREFDIRRIDFILGINELPEHGFIRGKNRDS